MTTADHEQTPRASTEPAIHLGRSRLPFFATSHGQLQNIGRPSTMAGSHPVPEQRPLAHLPALDSLRGIAVLSVMLFHFGGGLEGPARSGTEIFPALHVGARGVTLFFVLSGFLITRILLVNKATPRYFRIFFARRTLRIFPLYYVVLIVALFVWPSVLGQATWQSDAVDNAWWLLTYCQNLLLAWRGVWCLGPFDHFWSLAVEEQFYLFRPVAIYNLSTRQTKWLCLSMFLAATISRLLWSQMGGNEVARYTLTWFRMDSLAAGAWIAVAMHERGKLSHLIPGAILFFLTSVFAFGTMTAFNWHLPSVNDTLWTVAFAALLILMVEAKPQSALARLNLSPVLHWFGKYSYGMYLLGNLLIWIVAPVLTASGLGAATGNVYLGQWLYVAIMMALTSTVAVISWHVVEAPFLHFKRRFSD